MCACLPQGTWTQDSASCAGHETTSPLAGLQGQACPCPHRRQVTQGHTGRSVALQELAQACRASSAGGGGGGGSTAGGAGGDSATQEPPCFPPQVLLTTAQGLPSLQAPPSPRHAPGTAEARLSQGATLQAGTQVQQAQEQAQAEDTSMLPPGFHGQCRGVWSHEVQHGACVRALLAVPGGCAGYMACSCVLQVLEPVQACCRWHLVSCARCAHSRPCPTACGCHTASSV